MLVHATVPASPYKYLREGSNKKLLSMEGTISVLLVLFIEVT